MNRLEGLMDDGLKLIDKVLRRVPPALIESTDSYWQQEVGPATVEMIKDAVWMLYEGLREENEDLAFATLNTSAGLIGEAVKLAYCLGWLEGQQRGCPSCGQFWAVHNDDGSCVEDHQEIAVYADGSCIGNPGPGGWGVYVLETGEKWSGHIRETTNNRAELTAILQALKLIPEGASVEIRTDSSLAVNWLNGTFQRNNRQIQLICAHIEKVVEARDLDVKYVHIYRDSESGNVVADKLAQDAARGGEYGT